VFASARLTQRRTLDIALHAQPAAAGETWSARPRAVVERDRSVTRRDGRTEGVFEGAAKGAVEGVEDGKTEGKA
jgi:hypothetical protein